jgi:hypothetical protein
MASLSMELQIVELHFAEQPSIEFARMRSRAEAILAEKLDAPDPDETNVYLLFQKNHLCRFDDGCIPAQTAILAGHQPIDLRLYANEVQQSWRCPNSESLIRDSRHTLLVTEMMTRLLPAADRLQLFHGVLQAVIEETAPVALVFKHSQQVIDPKTYLEAVASKPILRPGSLNVRFFRITNSTGDMVMDIRGLHAVGLHDLQCHFRDLDPSAVGRVLFNTAVHICENGPVIKSGQTVTGVESDSKWVCQFENSLLPPTRELLDSNPGIRFAAGKRRLA